MQKPPGRPATIKQRLFDRKMKPFEKLRDIDRDKVRLAWFAADDDVVNRVVLGGDPLQSEEMREDIAPQGCDTRSETVEIHQYFATDARNRFVMWKAVVKFRVM